MTPQPDILILKRKLARGEETENNTDHILIGKPSTPHGDTARFPKKKKKLGARNKRSPLTFVGQAYFSDGLMTDITGRRKRRRRKREEERKKKRFWSQWPYTTNIVKHAS